MVNQMSKPTQESQLGENRILVIEDEPSVAEVVSLYLRRAGFSVQVFQDGSKALEALETIQPALVVLDLMLPGADGWTITRWLRSRGDTPIIMLTARREEIDRIAGLEMGADDYIVKPFSPQELVSRVRAVLRRTRRDEDNEQDSVLILGNIRIDSQKRLVFKDENEITLTVKEFDLLWFLMRHPRQVFTRDQLLENVWGLAEYIDPGTVTVHIRRLREKIEQDSSKPVHLMTVWGVGYKFET